MDDKIPYRPRPFCRVAYYYFGPNKPWWVNAGLITAFSLFIPAVILDNRGEIFWRNVCILIPMALLVFLHLWAFFARQINNRDLARLADQHGITVSELEEKIYIVR